MRAVVVLPSPSPPFLRGCLFLVVTRIFGTSLHRCSVRVRCTFPRSLSSLIETGFFNSARCIDCYSLWNTSLASLNGHHPPMHARRASREGFGWKCIPEHLGESGWRNYSYNQRKEAESCEREEGIYLMNSQVPLAVSPASFLQVDAPTGLIMPARFDRSSRCPDELVRRLRVTVSSQDPCWKGKLLDTYDTCHDRFQIAPCSWALDWRYFAFRMLQLSDSDILSNCSTSPLAESPDFVENERRMFNYLINYPDWRKTFINKRPRIFERTPDGGWVRFSQ